MVRGEADTEIDREDRLLHRDEGERLERRQHPQHDRQVAPDVQRDQRALDERRSVSVLQHSLDAVVVQADAAKEHQREEEPRLPARERRGEAVLLRALVTGLPGDQRRVEVRVESHGVRIRVVCAVLGDPPSEVEADQRVAYTESEEAVRPTGSEDLLVAHVVADEAELGEHEPEERRDPQRAPGVANEEQPDPSECEHEDRAHDFDAVVRGATIEQPCQSDLGGERTKVAVGALDRGCGHGISSRCWSECGGGGMLVRESQRSCDELNLLL